jgi:hypothetical protein
MASQRTWLVLVAAAALSVGVVPLARADTTVARIPLSFVTNDQCGLDGEPIAVEGTMVVVSTFTSNQEDVFREGAIAVTHLVGFGLETGDRYVFNASGHLFESTFSNRASLVMEADRAVQIHAGETTPLDDFHMRSFLNPDGHVVDESGCF